MRKRAVPRLKKGGEKAKASWFADLYSFNSLPRYRRLCVFFGMHNKEKRAMGLVVALLFALALILALGALLRSHVSLSLFFLSSNLSTPKTPGGACPMGKGHGFLITRCFA